MSTDLLGIAKRAKSEKAQRFRNLYGLLTESYLEQCWKSINKKAAVGVDRVSAVEYGANLTENISSLTERLKAKRYRAQQIRRHYIPKGEGKTRPLGIPVVEDKLLQLGVAKILEAIYEQDFLPCSFGYRPGVSARDAIECVTVKLQFGKFGYIVEADIKGYFDNIDHDWLMRMLKQRIDDKPFLRLIKKWLKAGVLETDGKIINPTAGSPQGGIISPILSNIYLHYVLDLWFEKVKRSCQGEARLIRYADDWVCAFQFQEDAKRFFQELPKRLAKFGLTLSLEKTRIVRFSRFTGNRPNFEFLGFQFRWGRDRNGKTHLKRESAPKKFQASVKALIAWCKQLRHLKTKLLLQQLKTKLRGYYNYYGIHGNMKAVGRFHLIVTTNLFKWLNRRSGRLSYNWTGFNSYLKHFKIQPPTVGVRPTRLYA